MPANQLLFKDVGAKTLLFSPEGFEVLKDLHSHTKDGMRWVETPTFEEITSNETAETYPFTATFEEVKNKPFMALHTSGTTGHPKYVPLAKSDPAIWFC